MFIMLFTVGLNHMIQKEKIENVKVVALHPGLVNTEIDKERKRDSRFYKIIRSCTRCCRKTPSEGAKNTNNLAKAPFDSLVSGAFYDSKSTPQ